MNSTSTAPMSAATMLVAAAFLVLMSCTHGETLSPSDGGASGPTEDRPDETAPGDFKLVPLREELHGDPDDIGRDAIAAMRAWWPAFCKAHEGGDELSCRYDVPGYASMLECEQKANVAAQAARQALPPHQAQFKCGQRIESAIENHVTMRAALLGGQDAWLRAHRDPLARCMRSDRAFSGCDDDPALRGEPSLLDPQFKAAGTVDVIGLACMNRFLRCETASDSLCTIMAVVDRLGLTCGHHPGKRAGGGIFVRATGTRLL